jgi:hypothetical protein
MSLDRRLSELPQTAGRVMPGDLAYIVRAGVSYAVQVRDLVGAALGPENQETLSLTSNYTLAVSVRNVVLITPSAGSWEVTIPNALENGGWVWLRNESATFNFIVKDAGGTTLATIEADGFGLFSN